MKKNILISLTPPRLIDYVLFVGSSQPNLNVNKDVRPELVRMYPTEQHEDFLLPKDIVYFCQPDGCYNITFNSPSDYHEFNKLPKHNKINRTFVFSVLDKDTNITRYGVCLNFLRPIQRRKRKSYKQKMSKVQYSSEKSDYSEPNDNPDKFQNYTNKQCIISKSLYKYTLTSICIISHYQFFKQFEKCIIFLYELIQILYKSCRPRKLGMETVWSVLTGGNIQSTTVLVHQSIQEIDKWILHLISAPAPVASKTCIKLYLQPEKYAQPIIFAIPDKTRLSLADIQLYLPIQLLGIPKFLKVFITLALEKKVILQSSYYDRLTNCVMAFIFLLYPIQYLFTTIPLLPSCMHGVEQLLEVPSPYIIGLSSNFHCTRPSFVFPEDVLLVNIDTQELSGMGANESIPKIPSQDEKQLISSLQQLFNELIQYGKKELLR